MKKKFFLSLAAVAALAIGVVGMSAFEAHVINVTARIENALNVPLEEIDFGTVFPQEQLYEGFDVALSESFLAEGRVDDVEYFIRQKPKCGITTDDGQVLVGPTATGHISLNDQGQEVVDCGPAPRELTEDESWGQLPLLCPYLSKHKADDEGVENDEELDAFHQIGSIDEGDNLADPSDDTWVWNSIFGRLAKSDNDLEDSWILDLKVPCFGDHCAQDWASFVEGINDGVDPLDYIQPLENEHKVFGCDLWLEVYHISPPPGIGCNEKADVMMVLDRSGSIDDSELGTLKTAAKAFVDALSLSTPGVHGGQSSFADTATLDQELTDNGVTLKAAIDDLVRDGFTNLAHGISLATIELASVRDRDDASSPDFMVIITDGEPNRCLDGSDCGTTNAQNEAIAAATAAKAAGATIYVVGVGTDEDTTNYLKNNIASSLSHYYDAADFDDLEDELSDIAICEE
ncbi:MAG: vWA domain-containing protein [bacterium]|nr:vWA domain-containing protein [bacterium]